IHKFHPDAMAPLDNVGIPNHDLTHLFSADRAGPEHDWQLSMSGVRRWHASAESLPEGRLYRPVTLARVGAQLSGMKLPPGWSGDIMAEHVVVLNDELRALAKHYYGD